MYASVAWRRFRASTAAKLVKIIIRLSVCIRLGLMVDIGYTPMLANASAASATKSTRPI